MSSTLISRLFARSRARVKPQRLCSAREYVAWPPRVVSLPRDQRVARFPRVEISPVPVALRHQNKGGAGSSPEAHSTMALLRVSRALYAAAALTGRVLELVLTLALALLLITRAVLAEPAR